MKIFADFYLYNSKKENVQYSKDTILSIIIKDSNKFINEVDKNINFDILVVKWSELINFLDKYGDIPLFKLLKMQKKFKICYGGYIKFRIIYNKIEEIILFKKEDNKNNNKIFLVYNFILKFLSNEDIFNLALINKYSYNLILDNKIFNKEIFLKNNFKDEEEKENKLINF